MTFLNPVGLLGLLALPVVIFLHLRREQSRRWVVSSLGLWRFLDEQMRGGKMRRLPITLLLLLDLLIATLFSLALARPQISLPPVFPIPQHVILLLDTSASMQAIEEGVSRYYGAQEDVAALLALTSAYDVVTIIAIGGQAQQIGDTRESSSTELLQMTLNTPAAGQGVDFATSLALVNALSLSDLAPEVHIFTDAAYPEPDLSSLNEDPIWHLYGAASQNQAVMNVQPGESEIFVELYNFSQGSAPRILQLYGDDVLLTETAVNLLPQQNHVLVWPVYGEFSQVRAVFANADAHPLDDAGYAVLAPQHTAQVLLIADESEHFESAQRALQAAGNIELTTSPTLTGHRYDLTVFLEESPGDLLTGNLLHIKNTDPVTQTGLRHTKYPYGDLYTLNVNQEFLSSPEFPLLVASVVEASRGYSIASHYPLGASYRFPVADLIPLITITDPAGETSQFNTQRAEPAYLFAQGGVYHFELQDIDGASSMVQVAVNAASTAESEIAPQFFPLSGVAQDAQSEGRAAIQLDLMPWLLTFALILLLLEAVWAWR